MAKKKQNTAFNVQVADFIRNHKKAGTAIDDEVTEKLVIPFVREYPPLPYRPGYRLSVVHRAMRKVLVSSFHPTPWSVLFSLP